MDFIDSVLVNTSVSSQEVKFSLDNASRFRALAIGQSVVLTLKDRLRNTLTKSISGDASVVMQLEKGE